MYERREMENTFDLLTLGMRGGENEEHFWSIKLNSKGLKVVSKNCFHEAKNKNYTDFGRKKKMDPPGENVLLIPFW